MHACMHACTHARTHERTNEQTRAHTHTHTHTHTQLQNGAYVESKVGQPQHGKTKNTVRGHPTNRRKKANSDGPYGREPSEFPTNLTTLLSCLLVYSFVRSFVRSIHPSINRTNERTNKQTRARARTHTQQLQNGAYVESKVGQPPQHGKIRNTVGGPSDSSPTNRRKKKSKFGRHPPPRRETSRARGEEPSEFPPTHPPTNQPNETPTPHTDRQKTQRKQVRTAADRVCTVRDTHTIGPSECLLFSLSLAECIDLVSRERRSIPTYSRGDVLYIPRLEAVSEDRSNLTALRVTAP